MKVRILGTALICALSAMTVTAQTETKPGVPPDRDAIPALPPPLGHASWRAEQRDGAFLEPQILLQPTRIPVEGIGLPPEELGNPPTPPARPRPLGTFPGPIIQPTGTGGPPLSEDFSGPAPSQPVMQGFEGMGPNGEVPPCPDLATGYDYVVCVTSDDFATYDRAGNELARIDIHNYLGISTTYEMHSPNVIFDPWYARWVMTYHKEKESTEESAICIVISENSTPFGLGNGWVYTVDAVQNGTSGKAFAAGFTLGYSNDYLTFGGNMHHFDGTGFLWSRLWVVDKVGAYAGGTAGILAYSNLTNGDGTQTFSPCASEMQASWSESGNMDATWINSRGGGGTKLTHWKLRDAFGANILSRADITVGSYSYPITAVQPDGGLLHAIGCRITSAVTTTDTLGSNGIELFTSLNSERSGTTGIHLYKIDPVLNTNEFEVSFGATNYYYFHSAVAADFSGSAVWVFARTANSAGNEPEIRFVDYDRGVFSSGSSQLRDGDGSTNDFYWGFYFGGQMDWGDYADNYAIPGSPSKVWLYGQYGKTDSWGTYIGATSVFDQGDLAAVMPNTTFYISGEVGGLFVNTSRDYTMTNSGDVGLVYEVTGLPPWLTATPGSGQFFPGYKTVTVSLNMDVAKWLSPGVYTSYLVFEDVFNGGNSYTRTVQLTVDGPGLAFCTGDAGIGTPCPCNNDNDSSLPAAGCANGVFASGAKMVASGNASVSADTLELTTANVDPNNSGLYFQANDAISGGAGIVFGDGLRCAGGGLIRLQVRFSNSSGVSQSTISIASKGSVSAGNVKYYQYWYRDTSGGQPCGAGVNDFNLSNGVRIVWGP